MIWKRRLQSSGHFVSFVLIMLLVISGESKIHTDRNGKYTQ